MKQVQLNVTINAETTKRAKKNAIDLNSTLGCYVAAAIDKFNSLPAAQMRVILEGRKNRKITGRPINPE